MAKPTSKRVTLADVAAAAGVSIATASVAITGRASGNCRVSAAVAERIRQAAQQLGYRPNLQARILSTQRTQTIGLLVNRGNWDAASHFLPAVQRALRPRGYTEIFLLHGDDDLVAEREHLEACLDRQVEGILILPTITTSGQSNVELLNRIYREQNIPVVQLGQALVGSQAPAVRTNEEDAFCKSVTLLHSMGHRQIVHATVAGYEKPAMQSANLRYEGYRRGMREMHAKERVVTAPVAINDSMRLHNAGHALGRGLAEATDRPTAIVALCDTLAAGVMAGLIDAGARVPEHVSMLGYGGHPIGPMLRPALSTVIPNDDRIAELGAQTLLKMIEGGEGASAEVPPTLEMRQSVADGAAVR